MQEPTKGVRARAIARTLFAIGCHVVLARSAFAACEAPPYRMVRVYEESTLTAGTMSLAPGDFARERLVCLAEALKERYKNRRIGFFIFSSPEAARHWTPGVEPSSVDRGGPNPYYVWRSQLHAMYTYDADKGEEYLDIKPLGADDATYDTRIPLPVASMPPCRLEIGSRCLLALEAIFYPIEGLKKGVAGTVTLTGRISRDGTVTGITVAEAQSVSAEAKDLFVREATANLASWRLEGAPRDDTIRITYSYVIDPSLRPAQKTATLALPNQVTIKGNVPD